MVNEVYGSTGGYGDLRAALGLLMAILIENGALRLLCTILVSYLTFKCPGFWGKIWLGRVGTGELK